MLAAHATATATHKCPLSSCQIFFLLLARPTFYLISLADRLAQLRVARPKPKFPLKSGTSLRRRPPLALVPGFSLSQSKSAQIPMLCHCTLSLSLTPKGTNFPLSPKPNEHHTPTTVSFSLHFRPLKAPNFAAFHWPTLNSPNQQTSALIWAPNSRSKWPPVRLVATRQQLSAVRIRTRAQTRIGIGIRISTNFTTAALWPKLAHREVTQLVSFLLAEFAKNRPKISHFAGAPKWKLVVLVL